MRKPAGVDRLERGPDVAQNPGHIPGLHVGVRQASAHELHHQEKLAALGEALPNFDQIPRAPAARAQPDPVEYVFFPEKSFFACLNFYFGNFDG